jgi:hypothetical protein
MIYINGDSNSAGAELVKDYCFANDDPRYLSRGRAAHPEAIPLTYGYKVARALNQGFLLDAESASSNARILRTTTDFLKNRNSANIIIIIGWTSWEREEWYHGNQWYQVTAGGTDIVPSELEQEYKQWVVDQNTETLVRKEQFWHEEIFKLHSELNAANIRHIFFNSFSQFKNCEQKEWGESFIAPYNSEFTFTNWLRNHGYKTVNNTSYHFGPDAHAAWANFLLSRLTTVENSTIIKTIKTKVKPYKPRKV